MRRGAIRPSELYESIGGFLNDIHAATDLRTALDQILNRVRQIVAADAGDIAIFNRRARALRVEAVSGRSARHSALGVTVKEGSFTQSLWDRPGETWRYAPDVNALPTGEYLPFDPLTRSEAVARIQFGQDPIGCLNLEWHRPPKPSEPELARILQPVADYAAIRVRIEEEQRQKALVTELLAEAPSGSGGDLEPILNHILNVVDDLLGFDGLIYIADKKRDRLEVRGRHCACKAPWGFRVSDHCAATSTFKRECGNHFFTEDARADPRVDLEGAELFNIRGPMLGLPLVFRNKVVGVIMLWSGAAPHPVEGDKDRLKLLCTLAAWKIGVWLDEHERELESQLNKSVVEHLNMFLFQKDLDSRFTWVNGFFLHHLKETALDAVIGKTDGDFFDPECAAQYRQDDRDVTQGKVPHIVIRREKHRRKDGLEMLVNGVKVPIRDASGAVIGLQCAFWEADVQADPQADVQRLEQVLGELRATLARLEVAIKARPTGGGGDNAPRLSKGLPVRREVLDGDGDGNGKGDGKGTAAGTPPGLQFKQLEKSLKEILEIIASDPVATWKAKTIAAKLKRAPTSSRGLSHQLQQLRNAGLIECQAKGGGGRWILSTKGKNFCTAHGLGPHDKTEHQATNFDNH